MLLRIETSTWRPTLLAQKQTYFLKPTWDHTPTWEHTHKKSMRSLSLSFKTPSLLHCFLQCTCLLHIQHHCLCHCSLFLSLSRLLFSVVLPLYISVIAFFISSQLISHTSHSSLSSSSSSFAFLLFLQACLSSLEEKTYFYWLFAVIISLLSYIIYRSWRFKLWDKHGRNWSRDV